MTRDPSLITLTATATILFAAIALFFGKVLRRLARARNLKLPHPNLERVFRLWFAALAIASLYLTIQGLRR